MDYLEIDLINLQIKDITEKCIVKNPKLMSDYEVETKDLLMKISSQNPSYYHRFARPYHDKRVCKDYLKLETDGMDGCNAFVKALEEIRSPGLQWLADSVPQNGRLFG
jgi:hypothetical protein